MPTESHLHTRTTPVQPQNTTNLHPEPKLLSLMGTHIQQLNSQLNVKLTETLTKQKQLAFQSPAVSLSAH